MRECHGSEEVLAALEDAALAGDGAARLHMGWGSFRNLDLVAATRAGAVLLFDINQHQFDVWHAVRKALETADDAPAFIDAACRHLPHAPRLRQFSGDTRHWLRGDLERPGSWLYLGRKDRYDHVRRLFLGDRVAAAAIDLRSRTAFERVRAELDAACRAGWVLQTMYVSNIPWMLAQPQGFFGEEHAGFLDNARESVMGTVRANLGSIAPAARWVVSALGLRADATPDNLQWQTELLPPDRFLDDTTWQGLAGLEAAGDQPRP